MPIRRIIEALMEIAEETGNPVTWVEPSFSFQETVKVNGVQYPIITTGYMHRIIYSTQVAHLEAATSDERATLFSELLAFNAPYEQSLRFGYSSATDTVTLSGELVTDLDNVGYVLKLCLELRQTLINRLISLPSVLHPYSETYS